MSSLTPEFRDEFATLYVQHTGCSRERALEVYDLNIRGIEAWVGDDKSVTWIAKKAAQYNLEVPQHKRKRSCT